VTATQKSIHLRISWFSSYTQKALRTLA